MHVRLLEKEKDACQTWHKFSTATKLLEFSVDAYVKLLEKGENGLYLSDEVKAMSF
jgi:hypothetical protein